MYDTPGTILPFDAVFTNSPVMIMLKTNKQLQVHTRKQLDHRGRSSTCTAILVDI